MFPMAAERPTIGNEDPRTVGVGSFSGSRSTSFAAAWQMSTRTAYASFPHPKREGIEEPRDNLRVELPGGCRCTVSGVHPERALPKAVLHVTILIGSIAES